MAEVNQYVLSNKELLELLIKRADVHEGRWMLLINFGITGANFGPSPELAAPGIAVAITQVGIQRAQSEAVNELTMDAAIVNPAPPSPQQGRTPRRRAKSSSST